MRAFQLTTLSVFAAAVFSIFACPMTLWAQDQSKSLTLTDQQMEAWKTHIKPTGKELAWKKIAWLPDLKSGIEKAAQTGKPVLLWTMNGHPLGCT